MATTSTGVVGVESVFTEPSGSPRLGSWPAARAYPALPHRQPRRLPTATVAAGASHRTQRCRSPHTLPLVIAGTAAAAHRDGTWGR